jgi:predicted CopG family antitoxin
MNNIKYYSYEKSTVLLTKEVYQRLREKGKFGETFSDIVERLLNQIDYFENKNKGGKIILEE